MHLYSTAVSSLCNATDNNRIASSCIRVSVSPPSWQWYFINTPFYGHCIYRTTGDHNRSVHCPRDEVVSLKHNHHSPVAALKACVQYYWQQFAKCHHIHPLNVVYTFVASRIYIFPGLSVTAPRDEYKYVGILFLRKDGPWRLVRNQTTFTEGGIDWQLFGDNFVSL